MNCIANILVSKNFTFSGGGKQKWICGTGVNGTELETTKLKRLSKLKNLETDISRMWRLSK